MTALQEATKLIGELEARHVPYALMTVRPDALMVSLAVPGERWEVEFFDDGRVLVERFVTAAVEEPADVVAMVMPYFDE